MGVQLVVFINDFVVIVRLSFPTRRTRLAIVVSCLIGLGLLTGRLVKYVVIWPPRLLRLLVFCTSIGITACMGMLVGLSLCLSSRLCMLFVTVATMMLPMALFRVPWTLPTLVSGVWVAVYVCR